MNQWRICEQSTQRDVPTHFHHYHCRCHRSLQLQTQIDCHPTQSYFCWFLLHLLQHRLAWFFLKVNLFARRLLPRATHEFYHLNSVCFQVDLLNRLRPLQCLKIQRIGFISEIKEAAKAFGRQVLSDCGRVISLISLSSHHAVWETGEFMHAERRAWFDILRTCARCCWLANHVSDCFAHSRASIARRWRA